jgi:hypothetical protein
MYCKVGTTRIEEESRGVGEEGKTERTPYVC